MPFKVVVIDDKPLIRQSIVRTIDWDRLDCEVVGQAEDGLEGRMVILEKRPDILITDIKMPGLSGLQLAELMQSVMPHSKTILITGYQEFEYARQAVRVGAHDFIVKPVKNEELFKVIASAASDLQTERQEMRKTERLSEAFRELERSRRSELPLLRSKLVADCLGGAAPKELPAALQRLDIRFSSFALLVARACPVADGGKQAGPSLRPFTTAGEGGRCRVGDIAGRLGVELIEARHGGDTVLVVLFARPLPAREAKWKLHLIGGELRQTARERDGCGCTIAASSVCKSFDELGQAYGEAASLLDASFFRDCDAVLFADEQTPAREAGKLSILEDLEQFNRMLEHAPAEELIAHLEHFLEQIREYSEGRFHSILVVKGLLSEVCLAAARYYFRMTGDEFGIGRGVDRVMEDIYRLSSMKGAYDYLAAFIRDLKVKLAAGGKSYSLMVKKVVDYINGHYAEELSLTSVADRFGLSPSYMSRLVRTETGINFVDLVSKARIEAAKRLLLDPKYKVNEVGEMVGYKEYAYFYQVFKRLEGCSPKEFINRQSGRQENE